MMRRIFLTLIMGVVLAGAVTTSTPFPVLLAMGCLMLWALSVAAQRQQDELVFSRQGSQFQTGQTSKNNREAV
jgi:hypothetical protein